MRTRTGTSQVCGAGTVPVGDDEVGVTARRTRARGPAAGQSLARLLYVFWRMRRSSPPSLLCLVVGRTPGAGKIPRPGLFGVELPHALPHCVHNLFQKRTVRS